MYRHFSCMLPLSAVPFKGTRTWLGVAFSPPPSKKWNFFFWWMDFSSTFVGKEASPPGFQQTRQIAASTLPETNTESYMKQWADQADQWRCCFFFPIFVERGLYVLGFFVAVRLREYQKTLKKAHAQSFSAIFAASTIFPGKHLEPPCLKMQGNWGRIRPSQMFPKKKIKKNIKPAKKTALNPQTT